MLFFLLVWARITCLIYAPGVGVLQWIWNLCSQTKVPNHSMELAVAVLTYQHILKAEIIRVLILYSTQQQYSIMLHPGHYQKFIHSWAAGSVHGSVYHEQNFSLPIKLSWFSLIILMAQYQDKLDVQWILHSCQSCNNHVTIVDLHQHVSFSNNNAVTIWHFKLYYTKAIKGWSIFFNGVRSTEQ